MLTVSGRTPALPGMPPVAFPPPRIVGRDGRLGTMMPELDGAARAVPRHGGGVLPKAGRGVDVMNRPAHVATLCGFRFTALPTVCGGGPV